MVQNFSCMSNELITHHVNVIRRTHLLITCINNCNDICVGHCDKKIRLMYVRIVAYIKINVL